MFATKQCYLYDFSKNAWTVAGKMKAEHEAPGHDTHAEWGIVVAAGRSNYDLPNVSQKVI